MNYGRRDGLVQRYVHHAQGMCFSNVKRGKGGGGQKATFVLKVGDETEVFR